MNRVRHMYVSTSTYTDTRFTEKNKSKENLYQSEELFPLTLAPNIPIILEMIGQVASNTVRFEDSRGKKKISIQLRDHSRMIILVGCCTSLQYTSLI